MLRSPGNLAQAYASTMQGGLNCWNRYAHRLGDFSQRVAEYILKDDAAPFRCLQQHEHPQARSGSLTLCDLVDEVWKRFKHFILKLTKSRRFKCPPSEKVHACVVGNAEEPGFRLSDAVHASSGLDGL